MYFTMAGEHHVAPAGADVGGEGDDAVGDGVHRIAEVRVSAATAVPVLAEVLRGSQPESSGFVVAVGIGFPDGEIEAVGEIHARLWSCG
jgi:hypothetical protein